MDFLGCAKNLYGNNHLEIDNYLNNERLSWQYLDIAMTEISQQDIDWFWQAIDKTNSKKNAHWSEYDIDEHLENLTEYLSQFDKDKLVIFERLLQKTLYDLEIEQIAELSIILENEFSVENGEYEFDDYLSTDGFIYFRCWLILKGKAFVDEILENIENFVNGKYSFDIGDVWAEGLLYVADDAYGEDKEPSIRDLVYETHSEYHYDSTQNPKFVYPTAGKTLRQRYPKLVADIVAIR